MNKTPDHVVSKIYDLSTGDNMPMKEIARTLGISVNTVSRYRGLLGIKGFKCDCGLSLNHRGFCKVRYSKSISRQKWMNYWHKKSDEEKNKHNMPDECYLGFPIANSES